MKTDRTLYQCAHAIAKDDSITCAKGHALGATFVSAGVKGISLRRLIRGEPLCLGVCQDCTDFDDLGPTPPKSERGWKPNAYELALIAGHKATPLQKKDK